MSDRKADDHRRKARRYLKEARETTDLNRRQQLLNLCEQELAAAAMISPRRGESSRCPKARQTEKTPVRMKI